MSTSIPLQKALAVVDAATAVTDDAGQQVVRVKVRGLMRGYDAAWGNAGYVPVAVETLVQAPLTNIASGRNSRTFTTAGKLDVVCEYHGRRILVDHKTTTADIGDPNAPYWRQLAIDGQVSLYYLLEWLNARKIDGAIWDVIKKPGISQKKLTKAIVKTCLETTMYCGDMLSEQDESDLAYFASEGLDCRESLAMYEARLTEECTLERDRYFQRHSVPRLDSELAEYAGELWDQAQEIISARANDRWTRNPGACLLYNTACQFLGVCSGHDTIDSDKWQIKPNVHRELPIAGDGRNVITNSRVRCFQTCRRKHYYQYELGVEQVNEDEKEALYFGTLMHLALEAWWNTLMEKDDTDVNGYSDDRGDHAAGREHGNATISESENEPCGQPFGFPSRNGANEPENVPEPSCL